LNALLRKGMIPLILEIIGMEMREESVGLRDDNTREADCNEHDRIWAGRSGDG
jgi:hypothetical protein